MAKHEGSLRQISVQDGGVTVTLGRTQTTVPADQIDSVIRALEAAKLILGLGLESEPEPEPPPAPTRAARAVAEVAVAAPARGRGRPRKKVPVGAQKRSRKRVGDALADWFRFNPGWHSTEELLDLVSQERMTDASPKRALMIALGKQRNSVFASDGHGNWKLAEDPTPAPQVAPKVRKKPGRKPGSGKGAKAPAAPARGKRGTGRPRGRPPKSASADKEGSAVPEEMITPPTPAKVVRVKRGEKREDAILTPQELEARRQAATAVDTLHFRWDSSSRAERERMRRNLFGDGTPKSN